MTDSRKTRQKVDDRIEARGAAETVREPARSPGESPAEKPVSLAPLSFEEALKALAEVRPNPTGSAGKG